MARLGYAEQEPTSADWSARDYVLAVLTRAGGAPAPMPSSMDDAAGWWLTRMCERKRIDEDDRQYGRRAAFSLNAWLQLSKDNREIVRKLVSDVPYRGECFDAYLAIVDETETMREQGVDAYRKQALMTMREALGNMCKSGLRN